MVIPTVARLAHPPVGAGGVGSLARAEAAKLVTHPVFLLGLVASGGMVAGSTLLSTELPILFRHDAELGFALFPLAGATMLAANLAATRERRADTTELHRPSPLAPARRTAALLVAVLAAGAVAIVLVALWVALARLVGGAGWPSPFEVLTGPVLVVNAGLFGVLLGRWVPSTVLTVVLVAVFGGYLSVFSYGWESPVGPEGWFGLMVGLGDQPAELSYRPAAAHLVYLVGIGVVFAAVAWWRHTGVRAASVVVAGALLVAGGGWAQTRPAPADVRASWASLVTDPGQLQSCDERGAVTYCVLPGYGGLVDHWQVPIEAVLERVPERRPVRVTQRFDRPLAKAANTPGPELAVISRESEAEFVARWRDDGELHPDLDWGRGEDLGPQQLSLALGAASLHVGLPTGVREHDGAAGACWAGGQARAVVALWLAATATPDTEQAFRNVVHEIGEFGGYTLGEPFQLAGAVHWAKDDIAVVLSLLDRPDDEVQPRLVADWDRWTAPTATTAELTAALGVEPVRLDDPSGSPYAPNLIGNDGRPVADCS